MRVTLSCLIAFSAACREAAVDATPLPPALFGPENQWPRATVDEVPADLAGTGIGRGDVIADFTLVDQHGDEVQLYQLYGQVVQLVLFAQWCGTCQDDAPDLESAWQALRDDGVVVLSVMLEASQGPTTPDALNAWTAAYGVTHPLLSDADQTLAPMLRGGYPTLPVLDRTMTIRSVDNFPFDPDVLAALAAE